MLTHTEALHIIINSATPLNAENCVLDCALNRFLARDILSRVTLPQYASAFKDGFAVRALEVARASAEHPIKLRVHGASFAGSAYQKEAPPELTACKITTGAYLPLGFDTVIPWEDSFEEDGHIIVVKAPRAGQEVIAAGTELKEGEPLLRQGLGLKPADIGLAAAAGHSELPVTRAPRVGIISTGNELVLPGRPLDAGQIYSSNQFQLKTQIKGMGMSAPAVIIPDDFNATRQGVLGMLAGCDALISSGGSADSEKDFMGRVLQELGWELLAEKIDIKPGHTLRYGKLQNKPFFVLPGTPSGSEICFNIFVTPLLLKMAGAARPSQPVVFARLRERLKGSPKNKSVAQAVLSFTQDGPVLTPVPKDCGRLKSIAHKNALVIVPKEGYEAGTIVEAIMV